MWLHFEIESAFLFVSRQKQYWHNSGESVRKEPARQKEVGCKTT